MREEAESPQQTPSDGAAAAAPRSRFPLELLVVWLFFLLDAVAIGVTYSRLPASRLYHVSGTGIEGGASRVLVFANYSTALAAIPVAALLADRLSRRWATVTAVVAVLMCAAVFWPGVVGQSNLDARAVNAIAAIGVVLVLVLSAIALLRLPGRGFAHRQPADVLRVVLAVAAFLLALPWIAADLGFYLDEVPGLGDVYQTGKLTWESPTIHRLFPTVHHGHHHGLDGLLLLLTALVLSRVVPGVRLRPLRIAVGIYLALMAVYAIGNVANDAWDEQVVKRGWTNWRIPDVQQPKLSIAWAVIAVATALLYAGSCWWRSRRRRVLA